MTGPAWPDQETEMVDLAGYRLEDMRKQKSGRIRAVAAVAVAQIQQHRHNLGGAGPPTRVE